MKLLPLAALVALVGAWLLLRGPENVGADPLDLRAAAPSVGPDRGQNTVAPADLKESHPGRTAVVAAGAPGERPGVAGPPKFVVRATSAGIAVPGAAVSANGTWLGETNGLGALTLPLARILEVEHRSPVQITVSRGALRGRRLVQPIAQELKLTLGSVSLLRCAGQVVDEAGRGLAGFKVEGGGRAAIADSRGSFQLIDVPPELRSVRILRGAYLIGKYPCALGVGNVLEVPGTFNAVVDVRTAGTFRGTGRYVLSAHTGRGDAGGSELARGEFREEAAGQGSSIEFRVLTASAWRYSIALHVDGHRPLAHLFEPASDGGTRRESVVLEEAGPLRVRLSGLGPRPARVVVAPQLAWGRAPALEVAVSQGGTASIPGLEGVERAWIELQTELSPTGRYLTVLPPAAYPVEKGEVRFDDLSFCTLSCELAAAPSRAQEPAAEPKARPILLSGTLRPKHVLPGIGRYSGGAYVRGTAFEEWLDPGTYGIHLAHGGIQIAADFFAPRSTREGNFDLAQDRALVFEEPPAPKLTRLTFREAGVPLTGRRVVVHGAQPETSVTDAEGRVFVHAPGPFRFDVSVEGPEGLMAAFRTSRHAVGHLEDQVLDVPPSGRLRLLGDEPVALRLRPIRGRHYFYPSAPNEKPTRSIVNTLDPYLAPMELTPGTWQVTVVGGPLNGLSRQVEVTSRAETTFAPLQRR